MDETEYEDEDIGGLPPIGAAGSSDAFAAEYMRRLSGLERAAASESKARRHAYEQARMQLEQGRYGMPSRQEELLRLGAAMLSPRSMPGIAGTLNNIVPVLAENASNRRTAGEQREQALAQLQQQYMTGAAQADREGAEAGLTALGRLSSLYRPQQPRTAWSERFGTFVREGDPVRDEGEDMILPDGNVFEAYRTERGMIYRGVVNGQQVTVDANGNPIDMEGGQ